MLETAEKHLSVSAALGLLQLKQIDQAIHKRQLIDKLYRERLQGIKGIYCFDKSNELKTNNAYFPILVNSNYPLNRDELYQHLKEKGINARRYFYPLISDFPMYRGLPSAAQANLPVAAKAAEQVMCLPIYPNLSNEDIDRVTNSIIERI